MEKVGRNERRPCGSGKKYKHCCLRRGQAEAPYGAEQRGAAMSALAALVLSRFGGERRAAAEEAWGEHLARADEIAGHWRQASEALIDAWFWFDRPLADGQRVVDALLASPHGLGAGERTWLARMRESPMRLYEIIDVHPGASSALREVLSNTQVTVRERTMSRSARRGGTIAARVIRAGVSGEPELELSVVSIPMLIRESVVQQLSQWRDDFRREHPGAPESAFWKRTPPFFHGAWMGAVLDPVLPALKNTDGEDVVLTEVHFEVRDQGKLEAALDAGADFERHDEASWGWVSADRAEPISLGFLRLGEGKLVLEANSAARGKRGRALVEGAAGEAVRFVAASHEDPTEEIRARLRAGDKAPPEAPSDEEIPREILEDLALTHLARHYRQWVDQPVPALGGETPRAAASQPALGAKVVELIRGIEGLYQESLRRDEPAYDPSWMWEELDLAPGEADSPPPMAHDRLDAAYPGLGVLTRQVAERLRHRPGFDDRTGRCRPEDLEVDLGVRRFLTRHPAAAPLVPWLIDFELHRRKIFWVDRALAWQLAHTDLDVAAEDLRLPFASFALVFTDRTVLSLAERLVATRHDSPIAGHFARAVTAFVSEQEGRSLKLRMAVDALGSDPPEIIEQAVPLADRIRGCEPGKIPPPVAGLVHVVVNAILYATSPGAEPQRRRGPAARGPVPPVGEEGYSSDEVWFLPGVIKISRLRQLQELERLPSGRKLFHRHLVRGHWRRPPKAWKDQRLRWIEPYWKGPDLGAVIERAYKLTP
jgi:hypothetical protein